MNRDPRFNDEPPYQEPEPWLPPGVNDAAEPPEVDPAIWEWSPERQMWIERMNEEGS